MTEPGRVIPGSVRIDGRQFLYVESLRNESFSDFLNDEERYCADLALPLNGGVIDEKAWLHLRDKRRFIAMSYKGDLDGWRKRLVLCCSKTARAWAVPTDAGFLLSDGSTVPFDACVIEFTS
jgi:hypothetical protein